MSVLFDRQLAGLFLEIFVRHLTEILSEKRALANLDECLSMFLSEIFARILSMIWHRPREVLACPSLNFDHHLRQYRQILQKSHVDPRMMKLFTYIFRSKIALLIAFLFD